MKTVGNHAKAILIILFTSTGFFHVQAQVRLAILGGIHSANVLETNNIPGWDTAVKKFYGPRTGFQLGVLLEIPVGSKGFFFQPGIDYSSKGRQYSRFNDSVNMAKTDTVYDQSTLKLGYVELPFYITYKIPLSANHTNHFFISTGPYFAFFYNGTLSEQNRIFSTNQYNSQNQDLPVGNAPDKYKTFDFGINAKAGFELGNVMLGVYMSRGLGNFYEAEYSGKFHHQLLGGSLGIWLGKAASQQPKPLPQVAAIQKDSDLDGIPDAEDSCPLVPGKKEWHGCPVPDTDHDGIDDEHDSCKTVPGVARYNGCPVPDRDHDGINDEEDRCPDQPGSRENQGCPVLEKIIYKGKPVMFKSSSSELTESSYEGLDELVTTMSVHPELHLTVEGHADSTGSSTLNERLSTQRAETVKAYLVRKGISPDRISTIGYGNLRPLGNNKSIEGKAMNRRVEFKFEDSRSHP